MLKSCSGALCALEARGWSSPRDLARLGLALRRRLSSSHLGTALARLQGQIQVKCHGMVLLHEGQRQLLWNDTLVKKGGGEGSYGASLVPFVLFRGPSGSPPSPETDPEANEERPLAPIGANPIPKALGPGLPKL